MNNASLSQPRQEALRVELARVAELLRLRRAAEIEEDVIDDLVKLSWLEWLGGSLQLTLTGMNICRQQRPR